MDVGFIDRYGMLPDGTRVLCAVSGGADSVCLLCRLLELGARRRLEIVAAHYNHGLRGAESDRDEAFVRALCAERGVPLVCGRGDVAAYARENGLGIEEAARTLRYAFLERTADETGCGRIATAHTADDNAETMLLNLARGTGLRGLCGIPPVRGRLVRPLLMTTRAEVEAYLAQHGAAHVEDSSNSADDYARNRVRHTAVPALESVNPAFAANAGRAAALLREDEAFLQSLARDFLAENFKDGALPAGALAALPDPVSARVLRLVCGQALGARHVEALRRLARGEGLGHADVPGMRVTREQGRLRFGAAPAGRIRPAALAPAGRTAIPEAGIAVRCAVLTDCGEIHTSLNTFFFNYESICGNILCTSRRDGDKIRLAGRGCTKKLSDLFAERGYTQSRRNLTPVFRDDAGVAAVWGFGVAQRCAARPGDTVLRIDIESGENLT